MSGSPAFPQRPDFGKARRLLAADAYAAVFAGRRQLRGSIFSLHYLASVRSEGARLGLVIPKKQARTAVLRNAIKRQAREIFRLRRLELPSFDLVLRLVRPLERTAAGNPGERARWRTEIAGLFDTLPRPQP